MQKNWEQERILTEQQSLLQEHTLLHEKGLSHAHKPVENLHTCNQAGTWQTITQASELPAEWDRLAGENIFLKSRALRVMEVANPCGQEYHLFFGAEGLDSILVTYRLKLDILTYSLLKLKLPVTIAGIPCSVAKPGYKLGEATRETVYLFLRELRGAKLLLNVDECLTLPGFASGTTLPTCRLQVEWGSFQEYLQSLRSHYRNRFGKAMRRFTDVEAVAICPAEFDETLYRLYLQVYEKSAFKLEKLEIGFFQQLPGRIIKFVHAGRVLAFVQLLENGEELIFVLGGFDYALNMQYDLYLNILLEILRQGIEGGFKVVDLGQTAEDSKLKLGARQHRKYMYFGHSNRVVNAIVHRYPGLLSYQEKDLEFHVFRS